MRKPTRNVRIELKAATKGEKDAKKVGLSLPSYLVSLINKKDQAMNEPDLKTLLDAHTQQTRAILAGLVLGIKGQFKDPDAALEFAAELVRGK